MSKRRALTISLTGEMLDRLDRVRRLERRTSSEIVREALGRYLTRSFPQQAPSPAEIGALRRARSEYRRGDSVSLDELLRELEGHPRVGRKKAV